MTKEFIDKVVVVLQSFWIDSSSAIRNKPRPGNGKSVRIDAHLAQKLYIFLVVYHITSAVAPSAE